MFLIFFKTSFFNLDGKLFNRFIFIVLVWFFLPRVMISTLPKAKFLFAHMGKACFDLINFLASEP